MAKVKFSALVSEMRNKLNGSVFARNRGGAYLRNKVTPVNPRSEAQVAQRNLLTQFSQAWRSLTQAQRDAWSGVVSQWSRTDIFGDVVNPSGNTLFTRLNINIANVSGAIIENPPSPTGVPALSTIEVTADQSTGAVVLTFDPNTIPADVAMVVEATPNMSPGISNANNQYRRVAVLQAGDDSPFALGTAYIARFGALTTGQKLFVRAKLVNMLTGEVGQALSTQTIVVA